ncbi:MAG TPA: DUF2662 domain-containing protein [Actinobacteria bacterium]|nr:DUF2662 domain-containing protein [Actinomycetota bacterium]
MHPVEMADRLVRQVDFLRTEGVAGPEVPNVLSVAVHPADLDPELDVGALAEELAHAVAETARRRGWRTGGPVEVEIVPDPETPRGFLEARGERRPGRLPAWGQLVAHDGRLVLSLRDNRVVVGRALDADVVVPDPAVSRRHAVVARDAEGIHLVDLGSANGTFLNGRRVEEATRVVPGDEIAFGRRRFVLRMAG